MDKILTVIVPSYNCEKFLDKCLASFVNEQVLEELEVIVVNDGSTDGTKDIAEGYRVRYPEVFRVISQENKGHGGALNTGVAAARGRFIKPVDADDWVETQNLPEFIDRLSRCDADVVLTHHYTRNISTGEVKKWKSYPEKFYAAYNHADVMRSWKSFDRSLTFHGITYNTEFYRKYGVRLLEHTFYEDHEWATIPCCYARKIVPFDMFIYDYRIGDTAQSVSDVNQLRRLSHTEAVLDEFIRLYGGLKLSERSAGRRYYCMKAQGLLLSYVVTALLVEKNKSHGRKTANKMMNKFKHSMPVTYALAVKQYRVFRLMNYLHISKRTWQKILVSDIYNRVRGNHNFE